MKDERNLLAFLRVVFSKQSPEARNSVTVSRDEDNKGSIQDLCSFAQVFLFKMYLLYQ